MIGGFKTKIIDGIKNMGSDAVVVSTTYDSPTTNEWGQRIAGASITRNIKSVSDASLLRRLILTSAGKLDDASLALIISGDEAINTSTDVVQFDGKSYYIMSIEPYMAQNIKIAQTLVLGEKHDN